MWANEEKGKRKKKKLKMDQESEKGDEKSIPPPKG